MGNVYEYFTAPTVTEAQRTLDNGPRGQFRCIDPVDVDPLVQLGSLETLVTGRSFNDQLSDPYFREEVAGDLEGDRSVVRIDRAFVHAMSTAETDQLLELVDTWAADEDFGGAAQPHELRNFIKDFQELCTEADEAGDVYCWISGN